MYQYMNPIPPHSKPTCSWDDATELIERFDARVQVLSSLNYRDTTIGSSVIPEIVAAIQSPNKKPVEEPHTMQYVVDGEVMIFTDRILVRYPEHPSTGLGNSLTSLLWFTDHPNSIELFRVGDTAFYILFDAQYPHQFLAYQTTYGTFEPQLTLTDLVNLTENAIGRIYVSYELDCVNGLTCCNELRLDIRRLRQSESRRDILPAVTAQIENSKLGKNISKIRSMPLRGNALEREFALEQMFAEFQRLRAEQRKKAQSK